MANYSSNKTVMHRVQMAINAAGYTPQLVEDGVNGPKTIAGVKWFQGQHGLTQDGIVGDQTVAATGPTPPGADPLAGMKAAVAALKATQDAASAPTAPAAPDYLAGVNFAAALAAAKAAAAPKSIKLSLRAPSTPTDATMAVPAPVPMAVATAIEAAAVPPSSPLVPTGIGAAVGAALGAALSTAVAVPLLALVGGGAALGAAVGFGASKLMHPGSASMHGEADFGIDFGCDDSDELFVIAGEIGMPSKVHALKG